MYEYEYPHPAVTVDVALFTRRRERHCILLIKRAAYPCKDMWALPGGFVDIDEDLETAARRELQEETGLSLGDVPFEQLYTFGAVDRDPRERIITVVYYVFTADEKLVPRAGDDAKEAQWFELDDLPALAFDHDEIIEMARKRLNSETNQL